MKALIKQKLLWIGLTCILLAAVIVICNKISHPSISCFHNLEVAVNKQDMSKIVRCYEPENQAWVQAELTLLGIPECYNLDFTSDKLSLIPGKVIIKEDGTKEVTVYQIVSSKKTCKGLEIETYELIDVNGKEYIKR